MAGSFTWNASDMKSAKKMERQLLSGVGGLMRLGAGRGERHMKHNAPWRDRTTNARNGLFGKYQREARTLFSITFGHTVDYGIYLEKGTENEDGSERNKPYPIIVPTVDYIAKQLKHSFTKLLDRIG